MDLIAKFIEGHEGRVLKVYTCPAGKPTFGVGRNIKDNPLTIAEITSIINDGLEIGAQVCFDDDLARVMTECKAVLGQSFAGWPPARQAAVMSMCFSLGLAKFIGFKDMITALREGRWDDAAAAALDSERARQLPRRSAEEALMVRTGEFQS